MADDLRVNSWLVIPAGELRERFSRSSGPGGQGVNTADTRVELSFDIGRSPALPEYARVRALDNLRGRVSEDGVLTVVSSEQRSQLLNRRAARGRMANLIREAIAPPPAPRVATRPSRRAKERRVADKRRRSAVKRNRRVQPGDESAATSGRGQSAGTLTTIASWVERAITTTASVSGDGFSSRCGTCGGTHT